MPSKTDMGHAYCKSAAVNLAMPPATAMEFLRPATKVRIMLMYYINLEKFLNQPDTDLKAMLADASESPPVPSLFD